MAMEFWEGKSASSQQQGIVGGIVEEVLCRFDLERQVVGDFWRWACWQSEMAKAQKWASGVAFVGGQ